jgi:hypothetical protein
MTCQKCGDKLEKTARFCPACGMAVKVLAGSSIELDDEFLEQAKELNKFLIKFNKAIEPRDHADLFQLALSEEFRALMNQASEALEFLDNFEIDDEAAEVLMSAIPTFEREFRIYHQTVKLVTVTVAELSDDQDDDNF